MNLETWIVVWLQIGLVCLVASVFARTRAHASLRQAAARGVLLLIPVVVLLNAGTWRAATPLPPAPISFATPVARFVERETPASVRTSLPAVPNEGSSANWTLGGLLTLGWASVALLLLGRIALGLAACRRLHRQTRPCDDTRVLALLRVLGDNDAPVRVGEVQEPMLIGMLKPSVYLPEGLQQCISDEQLQSILIHELTHIRHADLPWRFAAQLLAAVLWPQPAVRLLARSLSYCDEERCDQQVLASGVKTADYAGFLVAMAEGHRRTPQPVGAVAMTSSLGRRVKTLLSRHMPAPRNLSRATKIGLIGAQLAALAALFFFVGAAKPAHPSQVLTGSLDHVLTVSLTDVDSKPLQDGLVLCQMMTAKGLTVEANLELRDGKVTIDPARCPNAATVIVLAKSDRSAYTFQFVWNQGKENAAMQLERKAVVKGRILRPDGSPAANESLVSDFLVKNANTGRVEFLLMPNALRSFANTDADGRFTTDVFPVGIKFKMDCPGITEAANVNRQIEVKSDDFDAGAIKFELGSTIEGLVTRDGKPVAGIGVGAQSLMEWGSATTDANGQYSIKRLPIDTYNVALRLEDPMQKEVTARAYEAQKTVAGKTLAGLDFKLIPGGIVRGKVTTEDGKPKARVPIGIYGPAHPRSGAWVQGTMTDENGEYMTRVPAGKQWVYIMVQFHGAVGAGKNSADITVEDGKVVRVDFRYPDE